jgi:hypothetical protein
LGIDHTLSRIDRHAQTATMVIGVSRIVEQ